MFVACRTIKVDGKNIYPGEEVPGFKSWPLVSQRANLNLGWIKEEIEAVTEDAPPPETETVLETAASKPKPKKQSKKPAKKSKKAPAKEPSEPLQPQE